MLDGHCLALSAGQVCGAGRGGWGSKRKGSDFCSPAATVGLKSRGALRLGWGRGAPLPVCARLHL